MITTFYPSSTLIGWTGTFLFLYYVWIFGFQSNETWLLWGANLFQLIASIFVTFMLYRMIPRWKNHNRLFFLYILVGTFCFTIAQIIWCFYELVLKQEAPFPSWADFAWICQFLCYLIAIGTQVQRDLSKYYSLRLLFDSLLLTTVIGAWTWELMVKSQWFSAPWLEIAVGTAYPLMNLAMLLGMIALYVHSRNSFSQRVFRILFLGIFISIVANVEYIYLVYNNSAFPM
ncbi:hypothetical protein [Ammoniphilus sp. 3BR4]|uniref:hypothetical protein n=1 Tax=Ammoniphilus sp. 3BR4 TaxID=3158265 RepID=UPI0034651F1D